MFERFTDRARRVIVLAQENARLFKHNYIGSEHILLGLLNERTGIAARALESLGATHDAVARSLEEIVGTGRQELSGHIPFTPRAKKILELSTDEARTSGAGAVDTHHLLLGLLQEGEGAGPRILSHLGVAPDAVRDRVRDLVAERDAVWQPGSAGAGAGPLGKLRGLLPGGRGPDETDEPTDSPVHAGRLEPALRSSGGVVKATKVSRSLHWDQLPGRNLSEDHRQGQDDPVVPRENLDVRLLEVLSRRSRNNALLVGESGVGKSALIRGLVDAVAGHRVPSALDMTEVWQVDHAALRVAAIRDLGTREKVVVVVEELDPLLAADTPGQVYGAAALNSLCHSTRPVVGTISPAGYQELVTAQPLLAEQFERIVVPPADAAETVAILTGLREAYQSHHGVTITDEAIAAAPVLAAEYFPDRLMPVAALDLIDQAGARLQVAEMRGGSDAARVVDEQLLTELVRSSRAD